MTKKKIIIIGGGAAGIGMGVTLTELGLNDFIIIEKGTIGNSFTHWPAETRFITPSFPSNGFGSADLNAVALDTSPAYTLAKERLSGSDYAHYLRLVAEEYHLPIIEQTAVYQVTKQLDSYLIETSEGFFQCDYIIFATGEYSFPEKQEITGGERYGLHYSDVCSWQDITGAQQVIIGGNESGIDAAIHLFQQGKQVALYTETTGLLSRTPDPSISLSPYTRQRFFEIKQLKQAAEGLRIYQDIKICEIRPKSTGYQLMTTDGERLYSENKPILCTGFKNGAVTLAPELFQLNQHSEVQLNTMDESLNAKNCFLIGPSVRNQGVIFCYIYKFRQRFAVIAQEIARRSNQPINQQRLTVYQQQAFYLTDCENCAVKCTCS